MTTITAEYNNSRDGIMTWTVVDDGPMIQVRAMINPITDADELKKLIIALVKRHPQMAGHV